MMCPAARSASHAAPPGVLVGLCSGTLYEKIIKCSSPCICLEQNSMKQSCLSPENLHTLQSSVQFPDAVLRRYLAETHWEPAIPAMHAHQRTRREVLALDLRCGPCEFATFDKAGDDATGAGSRLLVVRLCWPPAAWATVWAVDHLCVECELRPTLPRRTGQDLAHPEWPPAGRAGRRPDRRPGCLGRETHQQVLLDATLVEYMTASIELCGTSRQALADCAEGVASDVAFHQLLFEALLEGHRVHFHAGQSLGEAWRWEALFVGCRAYRSRNCWAMLRLVLINHQWSLAGRRAKHCN